MAQGCFWNVSVIVGRISQRDRINSLGSKRFATDTNQSLTNFYSLDSWPSESNGTRYKGKKKVSIMDPLQKSDILSPTTQHVLWDIPHGDTHHHPGKLSLCKGMPVMIKHNIATECGVTNGAEAIVMGWKDSYITEDKKKLDVLFVKLVNPATPIQLDGLPENVVPILHASDNITCLMPSDMEVKIRRDQV
jgi:hypothetical protein